MQIPHEDKAAARAILLGVFPSKESFLNFEKQDHTISERAIPWFIHYAFEEGIIEEENQEAFLTFLTRHGEEYEGALPEGFSFGDLIEDIAPKSINALIDALNEITDEFNMPQIQASMFTRLKKHFNPNTPKKRGLLRILAFWMAIMRPELDWNYEKLLKLPQGSLQDRGIAPETEGVVLAMNVQGRGATVDSHAVLWVKNELPKCIEDLQLSGHINRRNIESNSATSVSLRLPKRKGPAGEPRLYSQAIRDSLALAHQMAVRWLLSDYSSSQRVIVIAIYAGVFANANIVLQSLLETQLSGEAIILLTDFAHLCARVAEVKVAFECLSNHGNSGSSHTLSVWTVKYLWSYTYYDIIPDLLQDTMLPVTGTSYRRFQQELYFPAESQKSTFGALSAMHRFPQNTLLLTEIAKVLVARRMFYEADAIVSNILLLHPLHVVTRSLRMVIYANIALEQPEFSVSELAFNRAIEEGEFITHNCGEDEEVWCEFGLVHYSRALKYFVFLRDGEEGYRKNTTKEDVITYLKKAEESFWKGLTLSPSGKDNRCLFWLLYTQSILELFSADERLFSKEQHLEDSQEVFTHVAIRLFRLLGWVRRDASQEQESESSEQLSDSEARAVNKILLSLVHIYENSVLARSYLPNIKYAFSCLLWDFSPILTVGVCNQILAWLEEARTDAEKLVQDRVGIYALTASFVLFQSPEGFIECINIAIETIRSIITDDELQHDEDTPIDGEKLEMLSKIKLKLLHYDRKPEVGPLVRKE